MAWLYAAGQHTRARASMLTHAVANVQGHERLSVHSTAICRHMHGLVGTVLARQGPRANPREEGGRRGHPSASGDGQWISGRGAGHRLSVGEWHIETQRARRVLVGRDSSRAVGAPVVLVGRAGAVLVLVGRACSLAAMLGQEGDSRAERKSSASSSTETLDVAKKADSLEGPSFAARNLQVHQPSSAAGSPNARAVPWHCWSIDLQLLQHLDPSAHLLLADHLHHGQVARPSRGPPGLRLEELVDGAATASRARRALTETAASGSASSAASTQRRGRRPS